MNILLTGAGGFIASAVIEALLERGHRVVACARSRNNIPAADGVTFQPVDFDRYRNPADWSPLLDEVAAVVNCAGILRERRRGDFDLVHYRAPLALAQACAARGIDRYIQISALGCADDGAFIASKHRFDDALLTLLPAATVLRPSVVISTRGSYGGTSLLRALAALPLLVPLPGDGAQRLQPVLLDDLAGVVAAALARAQTCGRTLYVVGPEVLTLKRLLALQRSWLKLPPARFVTVPAGLVAAAVWFGQRFGAGPLGQTMAAMLARGNVAPDGALATLVRCGGRAPRPVSRALRRSASFVQDRWHARLYLLRPLLWLTLVAVWLLSGVAGLLAEADDYRPLLDRLAIPDVYQRALVYATSALDVALGLALLLRYRPGLTLNLMLLAVLGYTLLLGTLIPSLWLEPLGSLLKNLAVLAALLVYRVIGDGR